MITGLCMIALLQRAPRTLAAPLPSAALALTMLAAAWIFRWVVFMSVQGVPKYGAGLYPVSYTHLDVYKRQPYPCWLRRCS